jgi:monofunctional chorismate mutase, gram positive type, clade 1
MAVRGIRGAITVKEDTASEVLQATTELLTEIIRRNELKYQDVASIIFSVTPDITSAFPAGAARALGMNLVPLFCSQEIGVKGSLPLCIRVLVHVNTNLNQEEIQHVYMRDAYILREDLANQN